MQLDPVAVALKFGFLAVLYLFLVWVARSALRDLRRGEEPVVADDVSGRDLQGREPQWTRAKGADTFCPYGPWITTADEVPDPENLRLRTWINGELRQDSNTCDLIFGCQELVEFISQTCTLEPGDLILTGTPSGVGQGLDPPQFLSAGDTIRIGDSEFTFER